MKEKVNKLSAVLLRHYDVVPVRLQFNFRNSAELFHRNCKTPEKYVFKGHIRIVVIENELETFSRLRLPLRQIFKVRLLIKQQLEASVREWQVDERVIVNRDSHKRADKLKVNVWLESLAIEPVQPRVLVKVEHHVLRVENLLHDALKVFFSNPAHVNCWLVQKTNAQRQFQLVTTFDQLNVNDFLKRLVQNAGSVHL